MTVQGSGKVPQNIPPIPPVNPDQQPSKPIANSPKPGQGDQVIISHQARQAQALVSQLQAIPEVRQDKVSQVQQQVRAQAPLAPAAKVAEKLLLEG